MTVRGWVEAYLTGQDWRVHENANGGLSLPGLHGYLQAEVVRRYWLEAVYSPRVAQAHRRGDLHLHDLGVLGPYCVGWDLYDFLRRGLVSVQGKVAVGPPRHLREALELVVNLLFTLQGEAAGAQAVSNFDTLLAPFVRSDGVSDAELAAALTAMVVAFNVPARAGGQPPFTNLALDLVPPPEWRDVPAVVGGEEQPFTYGDCRIEQDRLNRVLAEVMTAGDAQGRGFTFPILTYNLTGDFPWEDPVGIAVARLTGRYGSPYFANFIGSGLDPADSRAMCCRLRLDLAELRRRGEGLFGSHPLTGSLGVVTINLPRLAWRYGAGRAFFRHLGLLVDLAAESLIQKRERIEAWTSAGLYPYSRAYLEPICDASGEYWYHHFNTVGVVGGNEACLNALGVGIAAPEGRRFALEVLDYLRERLGVWQARSGQLFNLEATPAESANYRLARLDRHACPGIRQAGDPDGETYYTNSTQLPPDSPLDLWEALDHQAPLQARYTGGTVFHVYLGEGTDDPRAVARLVQTLAVHYPLPYFTLTPTYSVCPTHGYLLGSVAHCPRCGQAAEVFSRVVGYYRPVTAWNPGKRAEFRQRRPWAWPD